MSGPTLPPTSGVGRQWRRQHQSRPGTTVTFWDLEMQQIHREQKRRRDEKAQARADKERRETRIVRFWQVVLLTFVAWDLALSIGYRPPADGGDPMACNPTAARSGQLEPSAQGRADARD